MLFYLSLFNDTPTTEIYTLLLHCALPFSVYVATEKDGGKGIFRDDPFQSLDQEGDRKSTRLNSSHITISYAVFCLKKKKNTINTDPSHDACLIKYFTINYLLVSFHTPRYN